MADTCVPLQLDLDSCMPKRLCCNNGVATGYNKYGACPPNQGYTVNSETCQCCRPPCTPLDHRVTFTVYRKEDNYTRVVLDGEECRYEPATVPGASKTITVYVSNPSAQVYIEESGLTAIGSCGGKVSDSVFGMYVLQFDKDCPFEKGGGYDLQTYQGRKRTEGWSIASFYYHTIDLVERYVSTGTNQGYWETVS